MLVIDSFGKNIIVDGNIIGYLRENVMFVSGRKFAEISDEGVITFDGRKIGYVDDDGSIYVNGREVGYIDEDNNFVFYKSMAFKNENELRYHIKN